MNDWRDARPLGHHPVFLLVIFVSLLGLVTFLTVEKGDQVRTLEEALHSRSLTPPAEDVRRSSVADWEREKAAHRELFRPKGATAKQ